MIIAAVVVVPGGAVVRTRIWSLVVITLASALLATAPAAPASAGVDTSGATPVFTPGGWSGVATGRIYTEAPTPYGPQIEIKSAVYVLDPGAPLESGFQVARFWSQYSWHAPCGDGAGAAVGHGAGSGSAEFSVHNLDDGHYSFDLNSPGDGFNVEWRNCLGNVDVGLAGPLRVYMPDYGTGVSGSAAEAPAIPVDPTVLRGSATGDHSNPVWTTSVEYRWRFTTRPDGDGDGRPDVEDCQPGVVNDPGEGCQTASDEDGDGVGDDVDACPGTPPGTEVDAFGCGTGGPDSDGDGVPDGADECPGAPGPAPVGCPDRDGDSVPDHRDDCPDEFGGDDRGCLLRLVALGDSYSSGEGTYDYDELTNVPGLNHCHRSPLSYSRVAVDRLNGTDDGAGHLSLACSGATVENLTTEPFCGTGCSQAVIPEPPQLERLAALEAADLGPIDVVTVGIGGNDAGFAEVVTGCMVGSNCVRKFDPLIEGRPPGDPVDEVIGRVADVLDRVHQIVGDGTRVILVGYPVFISAAYEDCPGAVGFSPLGDDEAEWMRGQILAFNRDLDNIVQSRPWADFLDLDSVYGENVLCNGGVDESWINAIDLAALPGECLHTEALVCHESFHPTANGHQAAGEALARCVRNRTACGSASIETVRPPWVIADLRCDDQPVTVVLSAGHVPTARADVIWGTKRADVIDAGGGRDRVCARGGGDTVTGGDGADTVVGGAGVNVLRGGAGGDLLVGGDERDELYGGDGADLLSGGNGRDLCNGGPGRDRALACETRMAIP